MSISCVIAYKIFFAQGDRDKLGTKEEVLSYGLPANINWLWLEDGDHDVNDSTQTNKLAMDGASNESWEC